MPDTMAHATHDTIGRHEPLDALIVGAGFAGLYQLHCLRDRLGLSVQVLEAADGVGGTWYWNRYPGARCDSESHCYSYSFSRDLEQEWEWSERYPQQPEILRYLNHVADRFDLRRDIRFGARVASAAYDDAANLWRVTTESGETLSARFLITAVGCLSTANVAKIPGLETFAGKWYHTGQWPHDGVDFSGKRVGVIGTGSTAIQAIPVIAEQAGHLTVFQRTPNYSVPARNGPLTPEFQRYLKDNYPELRQRMRSRRSTASTSSFPTAWHWRPPSRTAWRCTRRHGSTAAEVPRHLQGHHDGQRRPTTPPPSSSAPRSAPPCRTRSRRPSCPTSIIPTRRSGRRSTRIISKPTTATTSPWWTCARPRSSGSRRPALRRPRAPIRSTSSSSPPASTR